MFKVFLILILVPTVLGAVSAEDCNPEEELFQDCSNVDKVHCEITCDNFRLPPSKKLCPCEPKCICRKQYVKDTDKGRCVYRFQCPNTWWPWIDVTSN